MTETWFVQLPAGKGLRRKAQSVTELLNPDMLSSPPTPYILCIFFSSGHLPSCKNPDLKKSFAVPPLFLTKRNLFHSPQI